MMTSRPHHNKMGDQNAFLPTSRLCSYCVSLELSLLAKLEFVGVGGRTLMRGNTKLCGNLGQISSVAQRKKKKKISYAGIQ